MEPPSSPSRSAPCTLHSTHTPQASLSVFVSSAWPPSPATIFIPPARLPTPKSYDERLREQARTKALAQEEALKQLEAHQFKPSDDETDEGVDSDDSLQAFQFQHRPPSPEDFRVNCIPSSQPSCNTDHSLKSPSDIEEDRTVAARPRRTKAKTDQYQFRPSLHKPTQPSSSPISIAEQARIYPAGAAGSDQKLSIASLLKEKKSKESRGIDIGNLESIQEQMSNWGQARLNPEDALYDHHSRAQLEKAMRDLEDAYLRRAGEGLSDVEPDSLTGYELNNVYDSREGTPFLGDEHMDDVLAGHDVLPAASEDKSPDAERVKRTLSRMTRWSSLASSEEDRRGVLSIMAKDARREEQGCMGPFTFQARSFCQIWRASPVLDCYDSSALVEVHVRGHLPCQIAPAQLLGFLKAPQISSIFKSESIGLHCLIELAVHNSSCLGTVAYDVLKALMHATNTTTLIQVGDILLSQFTLLGAQIVIGKHSTAVAETREPPQGAKRLSDDTRNARVQRIVACLGELLRALALYGEQVQHMISTVVRVLYLIACDENSLTPMARCQVGRILQQGLQALSWKYLKGYLCEQLEVDLQALPNAARADHTLPPHHPRTWRGILHMLKVLSLMSTKSRYLQQRIAYRLLAGGRSSDDRIRTDGQVATETHLKEHSASDFETLIQKLQVNDPAVNPLCIPSSPLDPDGHPHQERYSEIEAKVHILALALGDLALQLSCLKNSKEVPQDRCVDSGNQTASSLLTDPASNSLLLEGVRKEAIRGRKDTPIEPTKAFKAAISPYADDKDFIICFAPSRNVLKESSASELKGSKSDMVRPWHSQLQRLYRIEDLLHTIYARVPEGRKRAAAIRAPKVSILDSQVGQSTEVGHKVEDEEDPIWKSRTKDSLQRLNYVLTYQCEMYTAHRRHGNLIVESLQSDTAEEEVQEYPQAGRQPSALASDRGTVSSAPEEAMVAKVSRSSEEIRNGNTERATNSLAKKRKVGGPRASDQRSIMEFLTSSASVR